MFGRLSKGDVFFYELTVPEGRNIFDIAASLDELGVIGGDRFLAAARDPSPIRDLAPDAHTLEGYLFPDTYRVTRHTTAAQLCVQMTGRFRQAWAETGASGPVHPVVTLASLVEKETARPEERPLVASVFQQSARQGDAAGLRPDRDLCRAARRPLPRERSIARTWRAGTATTPINTQGCHRARSPTRGWLR